MIRAQAREVDRILSAWVRGQALCCLILALFYALALTLAGLDLGLIVGMAAGLLSFIPYVGSITGGVTALGMALAQFPTWHGVIVVGCVLVVGQILEGYVIYPALPRRPRGTAGGVGDLRAVRRRRGVRLPGRDAGGAGRRHHRRAVPLLAAPLPGEPAVSGPASGGLGAIAVLRRLLHARIQERRSQRNALRFQLHGLNGRFAAEFLEAQTLGLRQHEYRHYQSEQADQRGHAFGQP